MTDELRLIADEMLGKLARELRVLGYDVTYVQDIDDDALLELAEREGRLLLTRDVQLAEQGGERAVLVQSRDPETQLERLVTDLELSPSPDEFLSRCIECNGSLEATDASDQVPESAQTKRHWRCAGCGRVYWHGTHAEDMAARLGHLVEDEGGALRAGPPEPDQNA